MNEKWFDIHVSFQTVTKQKLAKHSLCSRPIFAFLIYQFVMAIIFFLGPRQTNFV